MTAALAGPVCCTVGSGMISLLGQASQSSIQFQVHRVLLDWAPVCRDSLHPQHGSGSKARLHSPTGRLFHLTDSSSIHVVFQLVLDPAWGCLSLIQWPEKSGKEKSINPKQSLSIPVELELDESMFESTRQSQPRLGLPRQLVGNITIKVC